jgi:hypothetical protein
MLDDCLISGAVKTEYLDATTTAVIWIGPINRTGAIARNVPSMETVAFLIGPAPGALLTLRICQWDSDSEALWYSIT